MSEWRGLSGKGSGVLKDGSERGQEEPDQGKGDDWRDTPGAQLCMETSLPLSKSYDLLLWFLET